MSAQEAWIQDSLARLEVLETHKTELERSGKPLPPDLVEEITALYETLEAAADDEPSANQAPTGAPPLVEAAISPFDVAASPPPPASPPPAKQVEPERAITASDDLDLSVPRSKGPLVLLGLIVVGALGGGAWFWYQHQQQAAAPPPAARSDPKVITASSVPEDTQEPDAAQGGAADRTQGTIFKQAPKRPAPSSRTKPRTRPPPTNTRDDRKIELSDSNDPLAGVK